MKMAVNPISVAVLSGMLTLAGPAPTTYTSPSGSTLASSISDGEVAVQINENVRGSDVFIIQSTCAPTNDNLMEP